MIAKLLESLVAGAARRARLVALGYMLLAAASIALAAGRLGVSTDLNGLFAASLPWKQREAALKADFPQFTKLIVAVVDAGVPEEAQATADALRKSSLPTTRTSSPSASRTVRPSSTRTACSSCPCRRCRMSWIARWTPRRSWVRWPATPARAACSAPCNW